MSTTTVLYLEPLGNIVGGGQRSLVDLVTRLDRRRFRPVVVCGTPGTLVEHLAARGITTAVIPMPTARWPWGRAQREAIAQLTALLAREQVQLIHANQLRLALYGLQAARRSPAPVRLLFHARVPRYRQLDRWLDWYVARRSQMIVAVSEAVASRFPWLRGTTRLHVLYNAIDLEAFHPPVDRTVLRRRFGLPDDAPVIGLVGLLEPRRGFAILLKALPAIVARYPTAHLLIAGREAYGHEGYGEHLRRAAVRYGVANQVTFTGFLDDVPQLMGSLDVCVVPGLREEGFGRVVIEAGAMECPVVVTPLGGLRELVEDGVTGLLVPPNDPDALVRATLALLDEPARARRMGQAARQQVAQRFALPVMIQRLHQCYDEVMGAPPMVA